MGTLVFWHTSSDKDARALGAERPGLLATTLVIDGQQRLTSLYAVMRGPDVVGKEGAMRKITIAFRPRDGRFEVADAAIRNDAEFLPNVTELWNGTRPKPQIRRDLINALRDKGRAVDEKCGSPLSACARAPTVPASLSSDKRRAAAASGAARGLHALLEKSLARWLEPGAQEVIARAGNCEVCKAAFDKALFVYPAQDLELRQGARGNSAGSSPNRRRIDLSISPDFTQS